MNKTQQSAFNNRKLSRSTQNDVHDHALIEKLNKLSNNDNLETTPDLEMASEKCREED